MWLAGAWLVLLTFAVYGNALANPFLTDDKLAILRDARVQEGRLGALVTGAYWNEPDADLLYRPLVSLSYGLNWAVSEAPWTFRLPNLLLHAGVGLLLFLWGRALLGSAWAALAGASVFIVHPIHADALNPIVGRADLAAALFGLAAVWLWWQDGAAGRSGWRRPVVATVCFAAGALCKESVLVLPGVVLLMDIARPRVEQIRRAAGWWRLRLWRCYLPLLGGVALVLAARWAALGTLQRPATAINIVDNVIAHPDYHLEPGESAGLARWGTPLAVFGKAVGLLAWPRPLSWDYSYAAIDTVRRWSDPRLAWGADCLVVMLGLMAVSWFRRRVVLVALGTLLITYSIVSNTYIVIGTIFAERLLYLPSVGWCLLAGVIVQGAVRMLSKKGTGTAPGASSGDGQGLRRAAGPLFRPASIALLAAVCGVGIFCAVLTVQRNGEFHSTARLNLVDALRQPRSARLWASVAADAYNAEHFGEAVADAERALAICPEYSTPWRTAGLAHWRAGEQDTALECLARYFKLGGVHDEQGQVALADICTQRGDHRTAIALLEEYVATPGHEHAAAARNNLAWSLLTAQPPELRDPVRALPYAEQAITIAPGQADYIDTYITALMALDRRDDAQRELERLLPTVQAGDPFRGVLLEKHAALTEQP